ncbi:MAG: formylmethanofuran--tetrahydromethanopterin N-formyltransferase [Candidatus Altiarchaeota archaeon]
MEVEDTYAEAFGSYYSEVLITAKNGKWLNHAVEAVTGNASSSIGCDCEAGLDRLADDTPDGRIGALVQFHVPKFLEDPVRKLELVLIHRIGNSILTCPTASVYNATSGNEFDIGKKVGFFGDGHQKIVEKYGRRMVSIPIMLGEFLIEEKIGYADGVMGGNLWLMADSQDSALEAGERVIGRINSIGGVITPFPGGLCASGSKVGSKYKFMVASTHHTLCPTLKELEGCELPDNVNSVIEIVIDGRDVKSVEKAMHEGIKAASDVRGLIKISAGNYGGRLGKHKIRLRD